MKLTKDASAWGYSVHVFCITCHKRFLLALGWADTEGRAFQDYYCNDCARAVEAPRFINGFALEELVAGTYPHGRVDDWCRAKNALRTQGLE